MRDTFPTGLKHRDLEGSFYAKTAIFSALRTHYSSTNKKINRNNVPARTPEEYCRRAVFLQDLAFKFSKIFSGLHANSHGGRRV
jgi:hypothetical protein